MSETRIAEVFPEMLAALEEQEPEYQQRIKAQLNLLLATLDSEDHDPENLRRLLFDCLVIYAIFVTSDLIRPLWHLYQVVMNELPVKDRQFVYNALKNHMESGQISMNAAMPFLLVETEPSIVAGATIDFAMLGEPGNEDPLAAVKNLILYLNGRMPSNMGAMFGGLLALGDKRVNELLSEVKWTISDEELGVAVNRIRTGFGFVATVEFWIEWLEELQANGLEESRLFGQCATGLHKHAATLSQPTFSDALRNFGYMFKENETSPALNLKFFSLEEVGQHFADRLYALEEAEQPPKLLSEVIEQYALEPHARPEDRFTGH